MSYKSPIWDIITGLQSSESISHTARKQFCSHHILFSRLWIFFSFFFTEIKRAHTVSLAYALFFTLVPRAWYSNDVYRLGIRRNNLANLQIQRYLMTINLSLFCFCFPIVHIVYNREYKWLRKRQSRSRKTKSCDRRV